MDIEQHRNWEVMKALFLHWEDRERKARGELSLEEEIAQEYRRAAEYCDPQPRPLSSALQLDIFLNGSIVL